MRVALYLAGESYDIVGEKMGRDSKQIELRHLCLPRRMAGSHPGPPMTAIVPLRKHLLDSA